MISGSPAVCTKGTGDCLDSGTSKGVAAKDVHPTAAEVCNGVDDNCSGKIDAADPVELAKTAPDCSKQEGVCKNSKKSAKLCIGGLWEACTTETYVDHEGSYEKVSDETKCDDKDNNCSGTTDESCDDDGDGYCALAKDTSGKPKACPKGGGDCDDTKTAKGEAVNPGANESCLTAYDDNCNGDTNDDGADFCVDYFYDGDKDGWGDSGKQKFCLCAAIVGIKYTATKSGDCDDGKNGAGADTHTWHDSKTNSDHDMGDTCGVGACANGKVVCDGKKASCDSSSKSGGETCNDKDDDCDGSTDEALTSTTDAGCVLNEGVCKTDKVKVTALCTAGTYACNYSAVGSWVADEKSSNGTYCDNLDNDCDGTTDESITTTDVGECGAKATKGACAADSGKIVVTCGAGAWTCDYGAVSAYKATEQNSGGLNCDNLDNDCDGTTDEAVTGTGASGCDPKATKGVCAAGAGSIARTCSAGTWSCDYAAVSGYTATEQNASGSNCDNKDNDCDGTTDEAVTGTGATGCDIKSTKGVCAADAGSIAKTCSAGTWSCNYAAVSGYTATEQNASASHCDNLDNDCDGSTDESITGTGASGCDAKSTKGVCATGASSIARTCSAGTWSCNYGGVSGYAATEQNASGSRCDNLDNDCDGSTDESITGTGGSGCDIKSTKGVCAAGASSIAKTCSAGVWSCDYAGVSGYTATEANTAAQHCDNKDNDCNGSTDESISDADKTGCLTAGVCTPGAGQISRSCTAGAWSCDYSTVPNWEEAESSCSDAMDNDCNGATDGC